MLSLCFPATIAKGCLNSFDGTGLTSLDRESCLNHIQGERPRCIIKPLANQGGCSFTVLMFDPDTAKTTIIQFRLPRYGISQDTMRAAREVYGNLVPETVSCTRLRLQGGKGLGKGIQLYEMSRLEGASFSEVQPQRRLRRVDEDEERKLTNLMGDMASFFSRGWLAAFTPSLDIRQSRRTCDGRVGKSILPRLHQLSRDLPSRSLRETAETVRQQVEKAGLDALPVVLSHGDLLPSNILVEPESWHVSGIVDWAEAEWLPFGVGLYGVEHLLGYMSSAPETRDKEREIRKPDVRFTYYEPADRLREIFWRELSRRVPQIEEDGVARALSLARDLGVLLWHGFAWDDGRLDRVVNEATDQEEVSFLEAMLNTPSWSVSRSKL